VLLVLPRSQPLHTHEYEVQAGWHDVYICPAGTALAYASHSSTMISRIHSLASTTLPIAVSGQPYKDAFSPSPPSSKTKSLLHPLLAKTKAWRIFQCSIQRKVPNRDTYQKCRWCHSGSICRERRHWSNDTPSIEEWCLRLRKQRTQSV
jgi:hypothetical protein